MRLRIVIVPLIACLGLAGCGNAEGPIPDPPPEPVVPADGRGAIEHSGEVAARLILVSPPFEAGDTVGVAVENTGEVMISYGLGTSIERRAGEAWEDADADVYPDGNAVPAIGLLARAGRRAGPAYGNELRDQIPLPRDLEPGIYRAVKSVGGPPGSPRTDTAITLKAAFRVRPPGQR